MVKNGKMFKRQICDPSRTPQMVIVFLGAGQLYPSQRTVAKIRYDKRGKLL